MRKGVVVIGGGMAGCAAAIAAAKTGTRTVLLEKNDRVGGLSLVAGTFGANGQLTAMKEAAAMGAVEIPEILRSLVLYENVEMPGKKHVSIYDCRKSAELLLARLQEMGVDVRLHTRVVDVKLGREGVKHLVIDGGEMVGAGVFVDATGTSGPVENCVKYGNGCVGCPCRCATYGGRVSIASKSGVRETMGVRNDGKPGTVTAAFTLVKETLSVEVRTHLERQGAYAYRVPEDLVPVFLDRIGLVPTSVTADYAECLTLLDNGYLNIIGIPYVTQSELRRLPGFEQAQYVQPYSGWEGNAVRYMSVAPCDEYLKASSLENLFIAGEKIGGQPNGVTEVFVIGTLAGHNAARSAHGKASLKVPRSLVIGDFVAFLNTQFANDGQRHSMMWGPYFDRMCALGLYDTDTARIQERVAAAGMVNVFSKIH